MQFIAREVQRHKDGDDLIIEYVTESLRHPFADMLIQQRARVDAGIDVEDTFAAKFSIPERTEIEVKDVDPKKNSLIRKIEQSTGNELDVEGARIEGAYTVRVKDVP